MPGLLETARARRAVIVAEAELAEAAQDYELLDNVPAAEAYHDRREELAEARADAAETALAAIIHHGDGVGALVFAEVGVGRHDENLDNIIAAQETRRAVADEVHG